MAKKRTVKELKAAEEKRIIKAEIRKKIKDNQKEAYYSVPLEARRDIVRQWREGNTIGQIAEALEVSTKVVAVVIVKNTKVQTYKIEVVNEPEDVK